MNVVIDELLKLTNKYAPSEFVVVFDVDNTLLASNQNFGSDQWFDWQYEMLKHEPTNSNLVTSDFSGLLRTWNDIISYSAM